MHQLTLADLWAVDAGLGRGLQQLLDYTDDSLAGFGTTVGEGGGRGTPLTLFDVFGATFSASSNPLVQSYMAERGAGLQGRNTMEGEEEETDEIDGVDTFETRKRRLSAMMEQQHIEPVEQQYEVSDVGATAESVDMHSPLSEAVSARVAEDAYCDLKPGGSEIEVDRRCIHCPYTLLLINPTAHILHSTYISYNICILIKYKIFLLLNIQLY